MNNIKQIVESLSEDQIKQLIFDNEILERDGCIGECLLRQLAEDFLAQVGISTGLIIPTMMQIVGYASMYFAKKYIDETSGHLIRFPIGDWSGDGHEKCEWYTIKSNLPVERLREVHFKFANTCGFDIGSICSEYEEDGISHEILEFLTYNKLIEPIMASLAANQFSSDLNYPDTHTIIVIWLELLKFIDPEFDYSIIPTNLNPSINFNGFDIHGRHLNNPGYGVFY